jgi:hypothetical protein
MDGWMMSRAREEIEKVVAQTMSDEDIKEQLKALAKQIPDRATRRRILRETREALSKSLGRKI